MDKVDFSRDMLALRMRSFARPSRACQRANGQRTVCSSTKKCHSASVVVSSFFKKNWRDLNTDWIKAANIVNNVHWVDFANLSCSSDQDAPQFAMGVFVDVSQLEMWETFRLKCRRSFRLKCNSDYCIVAFLSKETKCEQCYRLSITASFCIFWLSASCQLMSVFDMSQMPSCIYSVACVSWDCGHLFSLNFLL